MAIACGGRTCATEGGDGNGGALGGEGLPQVMHNHASERPFFRGRGRQVADWCGRALPSGREGARASSGMRVDRAETWRYNVGMACRQSIAYCRQGDAKSRRERQRQCADERGFTRIALLRSADGSAMTRALVSGLKPRNTSNIAEGRRH